MNWLEELKLNTKYITMDHSSKRITLIHPHFKQGKNSFRHFLKTIKNNPYHGYKIEAIGFASIKGILILKMIERVLKKYDNIEYIHIDTDIYSSKYTINVKFK